VETLRSIIELIALVSVSALCIYLIVVLIRLKDLLILIRKDLGEIGEKAKPVLENLNTITDHMKSVSEKVDEQVGLVKGSLESVKQAADNFVALEERLQASVEEPIMRLGAILGAVVNRVATFFGGTRTT
jgi:methyl-accepting chemotaxis protein